MKDLELLRGLRLKEDDTIETLYDLYGADVYSLISKTKVGNASELTIETFKGFAQTISDFNPKAQTIWSALMGHARKVIRNHRLTTGSTINVSENDSDNYNSILNSSYSEIIGKIFLNGLSLKEATKYLNIPEGTARTRFRLAINSLKNKYSSEAGKFLSLSLIIQLIVT
jgi:hypothetical protein